VAWFPEAGRLRPIRFAAAESGAGEATARVMRDADGDWRGAVALSLA
jgi:hypothetical protein